MPILKRARLDFSTTNRKKAEFLVESSKMPMTSEEMASRLEIGQLLADCARAFDEGDGDALVDSFTADFTNDLSSFVVALEGGVDGLRSHVDEPGIIRGQDTLRRLANMGFDGIHVITNISIKLESSTQAVGNSYFTVFASHSGEIEHFGKYKDTFLRCKDGKWRILKRNTVAKYERRPL